MVTVWLSQWIPENDRQRAAAEILSNIDLSEDDCSRLPIHDDVDGVVGAEPPWEHIWKRLLAAQVFAAHVAQILEDPRLFLDTEKLAAAATDLTREVGDAYEVMCHVHDHPGLLIEPGDSAETLQARVDLRRANNVDADLPGLVIVPPDESDWTIEYRDHGGFLATAAYSVASAGEGEQPTRFWGYAPTPRSAAYAISQYFGNRRVRVGLHPAPDPGARWRDYHPDDAELSPEGPTVRELLAARGRCYEEHLSACDRLRGALAMADDLVSYLAFEAARLNSDAPQLPAELNLDEAGDPANHDHGGFVNTVAWVQPHLIVRTRDRIWGEFGERRPENLLKITRALATAEDLEVFTDTLFDRCPISLIRVMGWAGPIYLSGSGGIHRMHLARMLSLPWIAAKISHSPVTPTTTIFGLLSDDTELVRETPWERRERERQAIVEGLIQRGIVEGELRQNGRRRPATLHFGRLPAPWLLRHPCEAVEVNIAYERCYPGALAQLGIPPEIGTDALAWTAWLTE